MKKNLKMGLGILTVLATPFAVDAATGSSEAHAVQVKETTKKQVVTTTKQTTTKQTENTKKTENPKKEDAAKKDTSKEKTTSSVKTVSDKTQTAKSNPEEKKTGWTTNGTYYVNGKLANWWYDDGKDWYFFQNGKKHTGEGKDNAGKRHFTNGKYANGYQKDTYYVNGKLADWWLDDGQDWYFFKEGKKFTGVAKDSSGEHKFVNGKYAAATGNGSDGLSNVLSIAQSYLGVEMGSAEHKKIVDAYNSVNPKPVGYTAKYSDDWCDVFVTTVFQQAGLSSLIGRECGVQRHIGIMQQKGIWQGKVLPKAGDVITFDWDGGGFADHIGIVESVKDGVVTTIEGNSSPYTSSGKTKVNRKTYNWNASYIKGYARPNY